MKPEGADGRKPKALALEERHQDAQDLAEVHSENDPPAA
jgi:hypothetical protein